MAFNRETYFKLLAFAEHQGLMNEPFDKVLKMFNDPDRLTEPEAEVIIDL